MLPAFLTSWPNGIGAVDKLNPPARLREKVAKTRAGKEQSYKTAVSYARVSSDAQERDGFSIPAQRKAIRQYAKDKGIKIARAFEASESARKPGRKVFGEMVDYIQNNSNARVILVERTDRLTRNFPDDAVIEKLVNDLDVRVLSVTEGEIMKPNSSSSDKLINRFQVLVAESDSNKISDNARKGMKEKASQGIWSTYTPVGYKNFTNPTGKKIIVVDKDHAPLIRRIYECYASGNYTIRSLAKKMRAEGFVVRNGRPVSKSIVDKILKDPIYMGWYFWKGEEDPVKGVHEPIVSEEIWNLAQDVLAGKKVSRCHHIKHNYALNGLLTCADCGSLLRGTISKGRYIHYYCLNSKDSCGEVEKRRYIREEKIEKLITDIVSRLHFDNEDFELMKESWRLGNSESIQEIKQDLQRLHKQRNHLQQRIDDAIEYMMDGQLNKEDYDRKSSQWRKDLKACEKAIKQKQEEQKACQDEFEKVSILARKACSLFSKQDAFGKRKLLDLLLARCFIRVVKNGKKNDVVLEKVEFKPPFDTFTLFSSKTNVLSFNPYIRGLTEDMLPDEKRKKIDAERLKLLDNLANMSEDARREFLSRCNYIFGKDFDNIVPYEVKPAA